MFVKPVLEESRCLRNEPGKSLCTVCQEVCPNPGFQLNERTVRFPGDCIACHFCTAACPEGAIRGALPPLRLLDQTSITLRCERVFRFETTPIACVGAIPEAFLEAAAYRKSFINMITGPCERCELQAGLTLLEQRISRINQRRFLNWCRSEMPFSEVLERRRLLEWLWRSVKSGRMGASDYRNLLPAEELAYAGRMRPALTDRCIGCPVCEAVCPYHVFVRDEMGTHIRYRVDEKKCTGCQKCVDSCLFQGVKLEKTAARCLKTVNLEKQICPECQEVFFGQRIACPRCQMRKTFHWAPTTGGSGRAKEPTRKPRT